MKRISTWCTVSAAVFVVSISTLSAETVDWPQRFDRLPEQPNMIGIIHVAELVKHAKREEKGTPSAPKATVGDLSEELTQDLNRIAIATSLDLNTMTPAWEVSVSDLKKVPSVNSMARDERGYVDEVGGKRVVWSPRGTYFLPVDEFTLVTIRPANRQMLARWDKLIDSKQSAGVSDYLRDAAAVAARDVPAVIAMDLEGVFAAEALRQQLQGIEVLQNSSEEIDNLAKLLADVKGFTFAVQMQNGLKGKLKIDFQRDATPLAKVGKPLVVALLGRAGASLDDIADWKESVSGNSFSLSGPLSVSSLRSLLSLFDSPGTTARISRSGDSEMTQTKPASIPDQPSGGPSAAASLKYYKSVARIVEDVRNHKSTTMGDKALWNDRLARKIDNLPILDVDPELLSYGTEVASLLRGTGLTIRQANINAGVQTAGVSRSGSFGSGGYGAGGYSSSWVNLPNPQIAQVDAKRRAEGNAAAIENLSTIDSMTAGIRRQMTQKYNVEF